MELEAYFARCLAPNLRYNIIITLMGTDADISNDVIITEVAIVN